MSSAYVLEQREHLDKVFRKLAKKDKHQLEIISKKIEQILHSPYAYKPLQAPKQNQRRVHIGSFVLVYSTDEARKIVTLEDYAHHDVVYE